MKTVRRVIFYKNYFDNFYARQSLKIKLKIDFVLDLVRNVERIPEKYFKHLDGTKGLFEIRVQRANNSIRIFCSLDEGMVVVLFNAFEKKSQKTPRHELELAEKLRREYFETKII